MRSNPRRTLLMTGAAFGSLTALPLRLRAQSRTGPIRILVGFPA